MSSRAARVGAAVTAVGLGAAGYGIAWAATGPTGQAQGAGSDLAALAANNPPGSPTSPGTSPGPLGGGPRGHRMFRAAGGTLSAVGPDSITVTGPAGQSHTISTNSSTTYSRDGATAARSDLAVGQRVRVRLALPTAGGSPSGAAGSPPANP